MAVQAKKSTPQRAFVLHSYAYSESSLIVELFTLENGRMALSFELFLRLAAVFGRSDPVGFIMGLTRTANPELWQSLEALGVGKLVLQTVREHQFVNILRGSDDARNLSDEEFAEVLGFTQAAFAMAMAWRARQRAERASEKGQGRP